MEHAVSIPWSSSSPSNKLRKRSLEYSYPAHLYGNNSFMSPFEKHVRIRVIRFSFVISITIFCGLKMQRLDIGFIACNVQASLNICIIVHLIVKVHATIRVFLETTFCPLAFHCYRMLAVIQLNACCTPNSNRRRLELTDYWVRRLRTRYRVHHNIRALQQCVEIFVGCCTNAWLTDKSSSSTLHMKKISETNCELWKNSQCFFSILIECSFSSNFYEANLGSRR